MRLRIALMGIRGIPANYGGFETFAENIATRLVEHRHSVTVYGRSNFINRSMTHYRGVRIVVLPTIRHKYFDTVAHTFLSVLHALIYGHYDIILICNSINSIFSFIPRIVGQKVALNVDGLEWQRQKWNKIGQWMYRFSEILATILPNHIVTDSRYIQSYYLKRFHKKSTFIPYGAPIKKELSQESLKLYHLRSDDYILYVSRLEPENNAHIVVKAFEKVQTKKKLVIVGDAPYNTGYIQDLKRTEDPRILFTGYVFGQGYRELQSHAYCYIQATQVGGTHPALLEGMGFGNCILANDVPEHREVLEDTGIYFSVKNPKSLTEKLQALLDNPEVVQKHRKLALERVCQQYTWERICSGYETLFQKMK